MRFAMVTGVVAAIAVLLSGGPARAQASPLERPAVTCEHLPPEASKSVPAPFNRYMRLMCQDPVGQGLRPADGFQWTAGELHCVTRPSPRIRQLGCSVLRVWP